MIQGILTFEFILNPTETGEIEPEFRPIQLIFHEEKFSKDNYSRCMLIKYSKYIILIN